MAQVAYAVPAIVQKFDYGENEVVGFIEAVESHSDGRRSACTALDLDEAQPPRARRPRLDIAAEFVKLPVRWFVAEAAYGPGRARLLVGKVELPSPELALVRNELTGADFGDVVVGQVHLGNT